MSDHHLNLAHACMQGIFGKRLCKRTFSLDPQRLGISFRSSASWMFAIAHGSRGHAGVSQVAVSGIGVPEWVPEILGQHHGFSPQVAGKSPGFIMQSVVY